MIHDLINLDWQEIENLIGDDLHKIYMELTSLNKSPLLKVTFIYAHAENDRKYINFIDNLEKLSRINFYYQSFNLLNCRYYCHWGFQGKNSTWFGNALHHDKHAVLFFTNYPDMSESSMGAFKPGTIEGLSLIHI